jgi:hypothetical protein
MAHGKSLTGHSGSPLPPSSNLPFTRNVTRKRPNHGGLLDDSSFDAPLDRVGFHPPAHQMYVGHTQWGLLERGEEQIVPAGKVAREAPVPQKKSVRI